MKNKKIIFMGTPLVASEYLKTLIDNNINIEAVFTQPPRKKYRGMKINMSPVHLLAKQNNIDVFNPEIFDTKIIDQLNKIKPDLIVVMAYGKILPKEVLELPKNGSINIHVSYLPRWRGAAPIEYALINGDKKTGITIIKINEKLDAGPIIAQESFSIPKNINKLQLTNELTKIGKKLLINTISSIFNNKINPIDQNENNATYAYKITSEQRRINFNNSTEKIINHIKAHAPKPGAWFNLNNERIKIIDAKPGSARGKASTVLNNNFELATDDGSIDPINLQRQGKNTVTKEEFLRGYKIRVNDKINE
tara:strand:- start:449 stop:1372 length:924 start_codon:yes stop_codon:yes gene_type:complete